MRGHEWAALAWAGILLVIFLYVLAFDLWAHYSGNTTMTSMFRDWLQDPIAGPVIFGLYVGTFVALSFHFLVHGK